MKKLCTVAIVSLAALGMATPAWAWCHCCCGVKVCCKFPNAFSPPCCYPCGKWWPQGGCGFTAPGPNMGCGNDCGSGMTYGPMTPSPAPGDMPPATGAPPNYMPPAPTEVGGPQARFPAGPQFPFALANRALPMMPAGFAPGNAGYYPPMGMYPGYGAPPMAPGYGPPLAQNFGPPMVQNFGPPLPPQAYGPPMPQGYGPPMAQGYGPPMPQGYGPPPMAGYGPPMPQGYPMPQGPAPFGMGQQ